MATGAQLIVRLNFPPPPYALCVGDEGEPKHAVRPVWSLTRDEQRVLAITFVGGLASIIAGVMIVGLSLALLRYLERPRGHATASFLEYQGVLTLCAAMGTAGFIGNTRRMIQQSRVYWIVLALGFGLIDIVMALTWIGLAAGVK